MEHLLEYLNRSSRKRIDYTKVYIDKNNNVCVEYGRHKFAIARGTNDSRSYNRCQSHIQSASRCKWSLPSLDELEIIYNNLSNVNNSLEEVGGEQFETDGYYWCQKLDDTSAQPYRFSFATGTAEYWSLRDQNFRCKLVIRES